jgi:RHS repeat-associated protein
MMKNSFLCLIAWGWMLFTPLKISAQEDSCYAKAYEELVSMMAGRTQANFERAVFISENAFHGHQYRYEDFQQTLDEHSYFIQQLIKANDKSDSLDFSAKADAYGRFSMKDLRYLPEEKKDLYRKALANWAVFTYLTDTTVLYPFYHLPYTYASEDPFGKKDWQRSQVMNLLQNLPGNCYAMTALFKILSDRLHAEARLCTAPQHIYIQHRDPQGHYYNVELATAGHPSDGTIKTLTYSSSQAIQSGIALRAYDDKQSIGLCLVNLAKSYEHKYHTKSDNFLFTCSETVLRYDSLNLSALLLKQQVLEERVRAYTAKRKCTDLSKLTADPEIASTVRALEKHLRLLYRLGYREMPLGMQEIILTGKAPANYKDQNTSPYTTIDPKDKHRQEYHALYSGLFEEVDEKKAQEGYGYFTFQTATSTLMAMDTTRRDGFLIDPVAFAYDFGARMYDARVGRFLSIDPQAHQYFQWSPYMFSMNTPISAYDADGERVYFIGGAGLDTDGWNYTDRWGKAFTKAGIKGFTPLRNVSHDKPGTFPVNDILFTANFRHSTTTLEPSNFDTRGNPRSLKVVKLTDKMIDKAVNEIIADLTKNPLAEGEQLNLTGYSYGSVLQAHVVIALSEKGYKIDNLVLIGSPIPTESELYKKLETVTNVIREDIPNDELSDPKTNSEFIEGGIRSSPAGDGDAHEHFDLARPGKKADEAIQNKVNSIKAKGVK